VSAFDAETEVSASGDGSWATHLSTDWNIGDSANGGYALSPVLRALRTVGGHPDPISVTTHFLRPVQGGGAAIVRTEMIRAGRSVSVATGTLHHDGHDRLVVNSVFGDLASTDDAVIAVPAPPLPSPDDCVARDGGPQGVDLPITSRVEVRVAPERAHRISDDAVMEGWIRFVDGTPPSTMSLPLFADAFPPSLFARFGRVGWVPTIELTVHVRRRPAAGWIQARLECDDLSGGRMIETGTLWDSTGRVVARSRQLGLLLQRSSVTPGTSETTVSRSSAD
jgi:acyl-CoA thioesterase